MAQRALMGGIELEPGPPANIVRHRHLCIGIINAAGRCDLDNSVSAVIEVAFYRLGVDILLVTESSEFIDRITGLNGFLTRHPDITCCFADTGIDKQYKSGCCVFALNSRVALEKVQIKPDGDLEAAVVRATLLRSLPDGAPNPSFLVSALYLHPVLEGHPNRGADHTAKFVLDTMTTTLGDVVLAGGDLNAHAPLGTKGPCSRFSRLSELSAHGVDLLCPTAPTRTASRNGVLLESSIDHFLLGKTASWTAARLHRPVGQEPVVHDISGWTGDHKLVTMCFEIEGEWLTPPAEQHRRPPNTTFTPGGDDPDDICNYNARIRQLLGEPDCPPRIATWEHSMCRSSRSNFKTSWDPRPRRNACCATSVRAVRRARLPRRSAAAAGTNDDAPPPLEPAADFQQHEHVAEDGEGDHDESDGLPRTMDAAERRLVDDIYAALRKGRTRAAAEDVFTAIKRVGCLRPHSGTGFPFIATASDGTKTYFTTDDEKAGAFCEHVAQLHAVAPDADIPPYAVDPSAKMAPACMAELNAAIDGAASGKCADARNIKAEHLKYLDRDLRERLLQSINKTLTCSDSIPAHYRSATAVPVQKPNKAVGPIQNLRPVALTPVLARVTEKIPSQRVARAIGSRLARSQLGFRPSVAPSVACSLISLIAAQNSEAKSQKVCLIDRDLSACSKPHVKGRRQTLLVTIDGVSAFCRGSPAVACKRIVDVATKHGIDLRAEADWLYSFHSNRKASARVGGCKSKARNLGGGFGQGTASGPDMWLWFYDSIVARLEEMAEELHDKNSDTYRKFVEELQKHTRDRDVLKLPEQWRSPAQRSTAEQQLVPPSTSSSPQRQGLVQPALVVTGGSIRSGAAAAPPNRCAGTATLHNIRNTPSTPTVTPVVVADDTNIVVEHEDPAVCVAVANVFLQELHVLGARFGLGWGKIGAAFLNASGHLSGGTSPTPVRDIRCGPLSCKPSVSKKDPGVKVCGVTFDAGGRYTTHAHTVGNKAAATNRFLAPLRSLFPITDLRTIYLTCVLPVMTYACESWWPYLSSKDRDWLEQIHLQCASYFVADTRFNTNEGATLAEAGLQPLSDYMENQIVRADDLLCQLRTLPEHNEPGARPSRFGVDLILDLVDNPTSTRRHGGAQPVPPVASPPQHHPGRAARLQDAKLIATSEECNRSTLRAPPVLYRSELKGTDLSQYDKIRFNAAAPKAPGLPRPVTRHDHAALKKIANEQRAQQTRQSLFDDACRQQLAPQTTAPLASTAAAPPAPPPQPRPFRVSPPALFKGQPFPRGFDVHLELARRELEREWEETTTQADDAPRESVLWLEVSTDGSLAKSKRGGVRHPRNLRWRRALPEDLTTPPAQNAIGVGAYIIYLVRQRVRRDALGRPLLDGGPEMRELARGTCKTYFGAAAYTAELEAQISAWRAIGESIDGWLTTHQLQTVPLGLFSDSQSSLRAVESGPLRAKTSRCTTWWRHALIACAADRISSVQCSFIFGHAHESPRPGSDALLDESDVSYINSKVDAYACSAAKACADGSYTTSMEPIPMHRADALALRLGSKSWHDRRQSEWHRVTTARDGIVTFRAQTASTYHVNPAGILSRRDQVQITRTRVGVNNSIGGHLHDYPDKCPLAGCDGTLSRGGGMPKHIVTCTAWEASSVRAQLYRAKASCCALRTKAKDSTAELNRFARFLYSLPAGHAMSKGDVLQTTLYLDEQRRGMTPEQRADLERLLRSAAAANIYIPPLEDAESSDSDDEIATRDEPHVVPQLAGHWRTTAAIKPISGSEEADGETLRTFETGKSPTELCRSLLYDRDTAYGLPLIHLFARARQRQPEPPAQQTTEDAATTASLTEQRQHSLPLPPGQETGLPQL